MIILLTVLLAAYFLATLYMYISLTDKVEALEEEISKLQDNP